MPKTATVRELKNKTTALIREAEKGTPVIVTRRGKPVATLKPFENKDLEWTNRYPSTIFEAWKKKILEKQPGLAVETPDTSRKEFEKATRKIRRSLDFKNWKDMGRFLKGDRYGLSG